MPAADHETFHWEETQGVVEELLDEGELTPDPERGVFVGEGLVLSPPRVQPVPPDCASAAAWLDALPLDLGLHLVILLQAGATSLGLFDGGAEVATKSFKRYVVRGTGRAQPTHLKTRGKSRYGSRLRLQNARQQLEETSERVRDWLDEHGEPELVFHGAPRRLWADLMRTEPVPPFAPGGPLADRLVRIPQDLPVPTTDVLLRAYRGLCFGRLERG